MASDTAPAAVPGPNHDSTTPASPPAQGGLTGLLAPVEPARPATFNLNPADPDTTADQATAGASSATYHGGDNPKETGTKNGTQPGKGQDRSVIRAWLLAGAERWKKGADARNKRLDVQKARAQAFKEARTVTVNRAEKHVGGSTNSSTGSKTGSTGSKTGPGKSLNSKTSSGESSGGQKNTTGPGTSGAPKNGPAGRTNSTAGSSAGGGKGSGSPKTSRPDAGVGKDGSRKSPKNGNGGSGGGTTGTNRSAGSNHKNRQAEHTTARETPLDRSPKTSKTGKKDSVSSGGKNTTPAGGGATSSGKQPGKNSGHTKGSGSGTKINLDKTGKSGKNQPGVKSDGAKNTEDKNTGKGKDQATDKTGSNGKGGNSNTPKQTPAKQQPARTPLNTQPSRETGYRDGTRAAKVVAHVEAYRDGVRDGYRDTKQTADAEKTRLDKAHAARQKARTEPEDQPVTKPASSADYHPPTIPPKPDHAPGSQPIQVAHIDATHIQLGDGAARTHISRGEVRTLRQFQRRLEGTTDRMTRVAEAARALEQHAQEQAKKVTQLLEQAKGVKGGDKLAAALTKLEDAAKTQASKAAEIHKRAARAADACTALHANTETRYGGIYKAVVDSPETEPAELAYYREMAHA